MMKKTLLAALAWMHFGLIASSCAAAEWHGRIVDARTRQDLHLGELARGLADRDTIILSEKHNSPSVQDGQAKVIRAAAELNASSRAMTVAWEFLDQTSSAKIAESYSRFASGEIDAVDFLEETQGNAKNSSYVPILEAARDHGANLIGVNLSRAEKAPVVEKGIAGADPTLVPPGFELGGSAYLERFTEAMGGHAAPEKVANYFAAQCLTDDVMAYHTLAAPGLRFLVVGSFHADYFDGVASRFKSRAPESALGVVRFIDAAYYTASELLDLVSHTQYGPIADYAYFVNEPKTLTENR